jgi:hypothetical protein
MIPVRVPSDLKPVLGSERRFQYAQGPCPACGDLLDEGGPVVLVFVGIAPSDRKGKYANGGTVAVHAACAGVPDQEEA